MTEVRAGFVTGLLIVVGHGCTSEVSTFDGRDSLGKAMSPLTVAVVEKNLEAETEMSLVARIETQPRELVEFYEPLPGRLLLSVAGAPAEIKSKGAMPVLSAMSLEGKRFDWRGFWSNISGGAPMPRKLAAAIQRSDELQAERPEQPGRTDTEDQAPISIAEGELRAGDAENKEVQVQISALHGSGWCNTTYETWDWAGHWANVGTCIGPNQGIDEEHCWDHSTGDCYAQNSDAYEAFSNVCPYSGEVFFKLESDEGLTGSWTVPQNTVRVIHKYDEGCWGNILDDCAWVKTSVSQASGDLYNYRFFADTENY